MTTALTTGMGGAAASQADRASTAADLFARYQRDVNRLVGHLLGPDPEHDDIVQDVFVRVIAKAQTMRDPAKERAWVVAVTVSVVRNQMRRRRVRRIVQLHASPPEEIHVAEPRLVTRDLVRRGYRLLDKLAAVDRIVLILRRVQERPVDEVAALCRCSKATVKRRLRRAEAQLATLLAEDPELYRHLGRGGQPHG
ncbi:MAG: sigma-70 family RNA polymerase sigma factor [Myxococcota bacterium]